VSSTQDVNVLVDNERMKIRPPRYSVLSLTNHWRVIDGEFYRDCTVRDRRTGAVRTLGVRDELLGGVA
jgi:hypothetical protein